VIPGTGLFTGKVTWFENGLPGAGFCTCTRVSFAVKRSVAGTLSVIWVGVMLPAVRFPVCEGRTARRETRSQGANT
jgi:hypothetical protein